MAKSAFARLKAEETPAPPPAPEPRPVGVQAGRQASRIGKKTVIFYDEPKVVRAIKQIALDEDTTVQALMQEAVDLLMVERGKHAFGKR